MRRKLKVVFICLVFFLVVGLAGIVVVHIVTGSTFRLQTLTVAGSSDIFPDAGVFQVNANVLFMSTSEFSERIKKSSPHIDQVEVIKKLPRELLVQIKERQPVATFRQEGLRWYVDRAGYVMPEISRYQSLELPVVECTILVGSLGQISDQKLRTALEIVADVRSDGIVTQKIRCQEGSEDIVLLIEDVQVLLSPTTGRAQLSSTLLFLFKQFRIEGKRPKSVDLRFEKPVLTP